MSSKTELTFLGTGTSVGVPMVACKCEVCQSTDGKDKRLRSSALVKYANKNIVIDTGPDFRYQMLREQIKDVDAVFLTHAHRDHTAGLDDIRPFNFLLQKTIPIYASEEVEHEVRSQFSYIFKDGDYPSLPKIYFERINTEPFEFNGSLVQPIEVMHYKLPVLGFRFGNLAYVTDANFIAEREKEKLKGCEILVLNALRHKKHLSHFTLKEALQLIEELRPKKALLTHISHQLGRHEEISKMLPENVQLAYDGLKIVVF